MNSQGRSSAKASNESTHIREQCWLRGRQALFSRATPPLRSPRRRPETLSCARAVRGRSSWSEVIARLQAAGLNATSVQNPLYDAA